MELFVCSSNYQLLNAIIIVKENKIDADLIIMRESIWNDCNLDILITEGIFKEIYKWTDLLENLSDEKIKKNIHRICVQIKKIITYINKQKIWKSLPNKQKQYDKIHISYVDSVTLWIYAYFKRKGATLSLFEDGTYSYGCLSNERTRLRRTLEYILYKGYGIDECTQMYVKHPEKVKLGDNKDVRLIRFSQNIDSQIITNIVFPLYRTNIKFISKFKKSVIIFDQNFELNEVKKIQISIARRTADIFGNENVLVKMHPSSRNVDYGKSISAVKEKFPFELVMAYEDVHKKILISIFSTASMSPKLDYDQEPYVIYTYKLYGNLFSIGDIYLNQIEELKNSYTDEQKIAVPNNMDEFIHVLKEFKDEIE